MIRWRRVLPVSVLTVLTYVCTGVGVLLTVFFALKLTDNGDNSWWGSVFDFTFFVAWTIYVWRLNRWGLWISDRGVRHQSVLHRKTFAWADIAGFDTASTAVAGVQALRIVLKNGSPVPTTVRFHTPETRTTWAGAFLTVARYCGVLLDRDQITRVTQRLHDGLYTHGQKSMEP